MLSVFNDSFIFIRICTFDFLLYPITWTLYGVCYQTGFKKLPLIDTLEKDLGLAGCRLVRTILEVNKDKARLSTCKTLRFRLKFLSYNHIYTTSSNWGWYIVLSKRGRWVVQNSVNFNHCTCFQLLMLQLPTGTSLFHLFFNCSYHFLSSNRSRICSKNYKRICCKKIP